MLVMKGGSTSIGATAFAALPPVAARMPWASGSIDIEALVIWALRDQRAGATPTRGLFQAEAEASGLTWYQGSNSAAIERLGMVGCRIDISGPGRDAVHPVAEAVDAVIGRSAEAELLRLYARLGERPRWRAPKVWVVPEAWTVEGEDAMWCYAERRSGAHCPLIWLCDAPRLASWRATYVRWWDALEALAWPLAGRATGFAVEHPGAPRQPWLAQTA